MIDCPNIAVRESLPEYLHDALDADVAQQVQAHLAVCVPCTEELALMRDVLATSSKPMVDVTRVVAHVSATIPPYKRRSRFRVRFDSSVMRLAAGVLIAAAGVSAVTLSSRGKGGHPTVVPSVATTPVARMSNGLTLVGVSNLNDEQLAQLTQDMDQLDSSPLEEPESVTPMAMEEGL